MRLHPIRYMKGKMDFIKTKQERYKAQGSGPIVLEEETPESPLLNRLLPIVCAVSLTCYLLFIHRENIIYAGWEYHFELFKMVFPKWFLSRLPQHIKLITDLSALNDGIFVLAFISLSTSSAFLLHSLFRGHRSDLGPHLIIFSFAIAVVPVLLAATILWPDGRGKLTLGLSFISSLFVAIILVVLKISLFSGKNIATSEPEHPKYKGDDRIGWTWICILPLAVMYSFVFLVGYILIVGYDALAYHLPLSASWWQSSSILRDANIQSYYPGNTELLLRWNFSTGSERFTFLLSFFSGILCIYMIYKLGRIIGQGRRSSFVAACCAATVPMIPLLATTAYTDTFSVLFLLLGVFFLVRWVQTDLTNVSHLICSGLAIGLSVGSKLSMLSSALAITLVAIGSALRSRKIWRSNGPDVLDIGLNWSWMLTKSGAFFSASLLGGGYWYLRNLIEKGNPFYPVSILGLPGFDLKSLLPVYPGYAVNSLKRLLYPWTETYYTYDEGLGAVTAGIVIPIFLLWLFLRNRTKISKPAGAGVIYSITWISLLLFGFSDAIWIRYAIFSILISFLFLGDVWEKTASVYLKGIVIASFFFMTTIMTNNLAGGYLYGYIRNNETRAERLNVPKVVDLLEPARIFNAAGAYHTYGLMGQDYRHKVITLYGESKPEDVLGFNPTYILLKKRQEELFRSILPLERIGIETTIARDPVSLWKIIRTP
ncbi:MAG: hypothetical protein FP816_19835, partial [Desulfobacteraceae bacterium]|nr:hypothetical protein [Desulfobacteraceae bacterium]